MRSTISILLFFFVLPATVILADDDFEIGFFESRCPKAEEIISHVVKKQFVNDDSVTAAFLRLQFLDCFVKGCDASILLDSTSENEAEKNAKSNKKLRYELIGEIKEALEEESPSKVFCADIIAVATRDAVVLAKGNRYSVPKGRREAQFPRVEEANNLPGSEEYESFASREELANDDSPASFVSRLASDEDGLKQRFADAKEKMGSIGVLVGSDKEEVRMDCRAANPLNEQPTASNPQTDITTKQRGFSDRYPIKSLVFVAMSYCLHRIITKILSFATDTSQRI